MLSGEVGGMMKQARLEAGMTQAARLRGISLTVYSRIECRRRKRIPVRLLCKIADLYGKPLEELLGRRGRSGTYA